MHTWICVNVLESRLDRSQRVWRGELQPSSLGNRLQCGIAPCCVDLGANEQISEECSSVNYSGVQPFGTGVGTHTHTESTSKPSFSLGPWGLQFLPSWVFFLPSREICGKTGQWGLHSLHCLGGEGARGAAHRDVSRGMRTWSHTGGRWSTRSTVASRIPLDFDRIMCGDSILVNSAPSLGNAIKIYQVYFNKAVYFCCFWGVNAIRSINPNVSTFSKATM